MDSLHDRSSMMHSQWLSKLELWPNSLRDWVWVRKTWLLKSQNLSATFLEVLTWVIWLWRQFLVAISKDHLHIPVHAATLLGPIKSQLMKAEIYLFQFPNVFHNFFASPSHTINLYSPVFKSSITTSIGFHQLVSFDIHRLSTKRWASTAGWMQRMSQWTSARRAHQIHLHF